MPHRDNAENPDAGATVLGGPFVVIMLETSNSKASIQLLFFLFLPSGKDCSDRSTLRTAPQVSRK